MVTKISSERTWTKDRKDPIKAYRDWLKNPNKTKKIFESRVKIKWYKIKESTVENKKNDDPIIKFWAKINWIAYKIIRNRGAAVELERGIKNVSLVKSFIKSKIIWKKPLRPIMAGPIRRCAYARNLRSVKTTNNVSNITINVAIMDNSLIKQELLTIRSIE